MLLSSEPSESAGLLSSEPSESAGLLPSEPSESAAAIESDALTESSVVEPTMLTEPTLASIPAAALVYIREYDGSAGSTKPLLLHCGARLVEPQREYELRESVAVIKSAAAKELAAAIEEQSDDTPR